MSELIVLQTPYNQMYDDNEVISNIIVLDFIMILYNPCILQGISLLHLLELYVIFTINELIDIVIC